MFLLIIELISVALYGGLFIHTWVQLNKGKELNAIASLLLLLAVSSHGYLCYLLIDGDQGQNLGLFNIFCMTTWLAMCLVGWNLIKHQAHSLLIVTIPVAAISIIEASFFQSSSLVPINTRPLNLIHIFSGIAAMSTLLLAALQSILVLYLNRGLRHHPANIHPWMGSLQSMERYLIQLLTIGFILMSISLIFVGLIPEELKSTQAKHKIILTIASWLVLAALLYGRYIRGWRGVFAAKWSLLGVFLLLLGYFGSKLVMEYFLT